MIIIIRKNKIDEKNLPGHSQLAIWPIVTCWILTCAIISNLIVIYSYSDRSFRCSCTTHTVHRVYDGLIEHCTCNLHILSSREVGNLKTCQHYRSFIADIDSKCQTEDYADEVFSIFCFSGKLSKSVASACVCVFSQKKKTIAITHHIATPSDNYTPKRNRRKTEMSIKRISLCVMGAINSFINFHVNASILMRAQKWIGENTFPYDRNNRSHRPSSSSAAISCRYFRRRRMPRVNIKLFINLNVFLCGYNALDDMQL